LDYSQFFENFGGAARSKNIHRPQEALQAVGPRANKRRFAIPETALLPKEFIRLCPWEMEYLFTIASRASLGIVETGRFNGGSLFVMACAAKSGIPIHSIDFAPQNDELLREVLALHCPEALVDIITGDSQHTRYPQIGDIDILFIDGDHSYEGCLADIENWYGNLVANGHLLFHDSYFGGHGVQDAIAGFMDRHPELQVIQPPFIGTQYWHYPAGSIAHFIKREKHAGKLREGRLHNLRRRRRPQ
jgi:predicted O-methyltransferase YrrM